MSLNSLRPATPITLTAAQFIALALAVGGVGFSVGALYPRLVAVEAHVADMHQIQLRVVSTLDRMSVIVERLEHDNRLVNRRGP